MSNRRSFLKSFSCLLGNVVALHFLICSTLLLFGSSCHSSVGKHQTYVDAGNSFDPFYELGNLPEFRCVGVIGAANIPRGGGSCVHLMCNFELQSLFPDAVLCTNQRIEIEWFASAL